jgi:enterochelin esterase family protein
MILLAVVLAVGLWLAQAELAAAANDFKPASTNQPGREYPQVNSEGRVRARLVAPEALTVLLDIGGVKYPMTKDEDSAWVGDSAPQDEGFHYYQLVIDGAQVPDPGSMYFYGAGRWGSGIEVPARDQDFYALKNVPHGRYGKICIFRKSPTVCVAASSIHRRSMTKIPRNGILCCIFSTAAAKMRPAGPIRAKPISLWTI